MGVQSRGHQAEASSGAAVRPNHAARRLWLSPTGDKTIVDPESFPATLRAARDGSEEAWTRIYTELAGPLMAYAAARGSRDPSDVVGDVFLDIARRIVEFEGSWDAFRGWAFLTASRRVIDQHRRSSRRPETLQADAPELPIGDVTVEAFERGVAAAEAGALLRNLSPDQREVLLLRIYADLPVEEVAYVTGRTVNGVKALQRRGLAALRKEILRQAVSR